MINISEKGDFSIEDASDYFESKSLVAQLKKTISPDLNKKINQIKKLSQPDITDDNLNEKTPGEIIALDHYLDQSERLNLLEGNAENSLFQNLAKGITIIRFLHRL